MLAYSDFQSLGGFRPFTLGLYLLNLMEFQIRYNLYFFIYSFRGKASTSVPLQHEKKESEILEYEGKERKKQAGKKRKG